MEQNPNNEASLPTAIVNLGNVPGAQGVSFHKAGNTLQSLISNTYYSSYYQVGGMYYVQVIGNNTDYSGSVGSHAAYQISPGQDMEFRSTNGAK